MAGPGHAEACCREGAASVARPSAEVAAILPGLPTPRVLVVSAEPVGDRMAGPAIRAYELARALAADVRVTLAAPAPSALGDERFELLEAGLADYDALIAAVRDHDVVVAQLLPPRLLARIWREPARLVVDLYNPTVVEAIEATRGEARRVARAAEPDRGARGRRAPRRRRPRRCARASASATSGSACWPGASCSSPMLWSASRWCRSASAPSRRSAPTRR